jgi:hypothetical protein
MGEIISMGGFLVVLISTYRYNRDGPPYPMSVETLTDVLVKGTSECRWVRVLGSPYEVTERWDKNKELIMVWKKESRGIQLEVRKVMSLSKSLSSVEVVTARLQLRNLLVPIEQVQCTAGF